MNRFTLCVCAAVFLFAFFPMLVRAQSSASAPANAPLSERYRETAQRILDATKGGTDGYRKLEELCDDIGNRLAGSKGLELAVDWAVETLKRDGQENVRKQPVMVPRWVRGKESLVMNTPQIRNIPMLGLGGSVGTPPEGLTGEVLSVHDEDELIALGDKAAGKVVLFDFPMPTENAERGAGYGTAVRYRSQGAIMAARQGAIAALVRSVTTHSLQTPHTGGMSYGSAERRIPAAAISVEAASMITRLQQRGVPVTVTLKMDARNEGMAPSANVIGEIVGCEKPDEVVVIGGHLDSWDVGQGAHDDGGGCIMCIEALHVLRKLELRPRRTIRVVLFTNEENGLAGGEAYARENAADLPRHVAAIESDSGTFPIVGYGVDAGDDAQRDRAVARLSEIAKLVTPIRQLEVVSGGGGADIGPMKAAGVPVIGQRVDMTHYFDYHHTHADTFDKINARDLDENIVAKAIVAYVLADMPERLTD